MAIKRLAYVGFGIVLVLGGYWVGFVGETSTEFRADGPQGPGVYEVTTTYPLVGVALIIGGLLVAANGAFGDDDANDGTLATENPPPSGDADGGNPDGNDSTLCPSCGAELSPTAAFCTNCGTELEV